MSMTGYGRLNSRKKKVDCKTVLQELLPGDELENKK